MKSDVSEKKFCDSIHSAIKGNLELEKIFISVFKNVEGEKKCQSKK